MNTQSSSKPRLKNDTIGNDGLMKLYDAHSHMGIEQFRKYCIDVVQSGGGNKTTKNAIISSIQSTMSKDVMLMKANNFCMAGLGLGV